MKINCSCLALALLAGFAPHALAADTTYIDIAVLVEGDTYPNQEIIQLVNGGEFSWNQVEYFWNATTYQSSLPDEGQPITVTLGLKAPYGESVDYWTRGSTGDPVFSQTFTFTVYGGNSNRVTCHITPPRQPITDDDLPRANTPTGAPIIWGPKSMDGGTLRTYSGEATEMLTDLHVKGRGLDFVWARRYLAEKGVSSANGMRWDFSYNIRVGNALDYDGIKFLNMGNGRRVEFRPTGYVSPYDYYEADGWAAKMRRDFWSTDDVIELLFDDGVKWVFIDEPFTDDTVCLLHHIEDRNGNTISFTYDTDNGTAGSGSGDGIDKTDRIVTITDTLGRDYHIDYYPTGHANEGRIQSLTDPVGRAITYTYAPNNTLTQVDYPDARTLQYGYSGLRLTEIVDPRGTAILTNQYSGKQVIKQTRPHAGPNLSPTSFSVTNFTYSTFEDENGKLLPLTIVNDPVGNVQLQIFNRQNQLAELRDYTGRAPNPAAQVLWDTEAGAFAGNGPEGKLRDDAEFTDPDYFASTFAWNKHDNLTESVQLEYDEGAGEMAPGLKVAYAYEDEDTPLKRGAVKTTTQTHPDEPGVAITTVNTYLDLIADPDPEFHRIALATTADPESNVTAYQYDGGANDTGNLTAIAYPGSTLTAPDESFAYNSFGQLTENTLPKSKDENGADIVRVDSYTYYDSGAGRGYVKDSIQASNSAAPLTSTFTYDVLGNLTGFTDPRQNSWGYTYTDSDEVQTGTAPGNGGVTTYAYDLNGNLETRAIQNLDSTGQSQGPDIVTKYVYDPLNRVEEVIADFGGIEAPTRIEYDSTGQVVTTLTPLAATGANPSYVAAAQYDERGAPFLGSVYGRPNSRRDYNDQGQLSRMVVAAGTLDAGGNPIQRVFTQSYDHLCRPEMAVVPDGTTSIVGAYDNRGLPDGAVVEGKGLLDFNPANWTGGGVDLTNPRFEYDSRGRVTEVRVGSPAPPLDPKTVTSYTDANQVLTVTDPDGITVTHGYDAYYRLKRVEDSLGNMRSYAYNENGALASMTQVDAPDGEGSSQTLETLYEYDALNRISTITAPGNRVTEILYDSRGNRVLLTDPRGDYAVYTYDTLSRNTQVDFYDGGNPGTPPTTITQEWDLNSRLVSRTDPLGKKTSYVYNEFGYISKIVYGDQGDEGALGNDGIHLFAYDEFGNVVGETDPAGNELLTEYDEMNRVTLRVSSPGPLVSDMSPIIEVFRYDGLNRMVYAGNANANVYFIYDLLGSVPSVTETIEVRVNATLTAADLTSGDPFLQALAEYDETSSRSVTRAFSHSGRPSSLTYPGGRVIDYDYNATSGLLNTVKENGLTIADYDYVGGRVARRTLGEVVRMDVAYDPGAHGAQIAGVTHSKVSGGPALENWTFDWDGNFNKVARHDVKRGVLHEYAYDARNRMALSERTESGVTATFAYTLDASGNRLSTVQAPDPADSYVVAGLHEYSASPLGDMEYDLNGNLFNLPDQFERYQYDVLNELLDRWGFGNVLHDSYAGTITEDYSVLAGAFTAAEGYLAPEGGGRILNESVPPGMERVSFSYLSKLDPGNPDGDPGTPDYGPDYYALFLMKVGQENQAPPDDEWRYLSLQIEPNSITLKKWENDEVTVLGEHAFLSEPDTWYDVVVDFSGAGNRHVAVQHGLRGGTMSAIVNVDTGLENPEVNVGFAVGQSALDGYLFDNLRIQADSIEAESMEQEFVYDALGRRVAKTCYPSYIARTTYYAYDGDRVIEELDGDGNVEASFVYGHYIDEVLELWRDGDSDGAIDPEERYYYLQDDMYNVLALADHNGDIVERYEYGDYGAPTVFDADDIVTGNESAYGNPYLFNGRHWDADTGLYWYRTRYMDPELGRFISRDTIGLWGDESNLGNPYTYAGNNPWSRLDPFGCDALGPFPSFGEVFGIASEAVEEGHETWVSDPIQHYHPNPGPVAAAIYNELLIVEPYGALDLYTNGNNAAYTGTQVVLVISPTKVFKIIKGAKSAVVGAARGIRGTRTAVMMLDGADEAAELARNLANSADEVFVTLNTGGDIIGDATRISKPKHGPVIDRWVKKGGKVRQHPDGTVEYTDWDGNSVLYRDGYPDFEASGYVSETVRIVGMKGDSTDLVKANAIAKSPLQEWETWHHHEDMIRMQKVPTIINQRFNHIGGSANSRNAERLRRILLEGE